VVPATIGGIVALVLLVLPGLAFELIRQRRRAGRDDSPFMEVSRILVAGLSLGAITEALLAVVSLAGPRSIVSLAGLFTTQHWVTDHLLVSGWTAWAYGLVSVTLAALAAAVLPGMNPSGHNHPESGWVMAFDRLPRLIREAQHLVATPVARLSVRLTDGTVYVGDRAEFSVGPAPEGRELLLGGELLSRPPGAAKTEPAAGWQRILLREDQISDIMIQYVPGAALSAPPNSEPRPVRRLRRGVAKLLGRPPESAWREVLEAPAAQPAAAGRLLFGELAVLLVVAVFSHLAETAALTAAPRAWQDGGSVSAPTGTGGTPRWR
jgi:hypothetical protein